MTADQMQQESGSCFEVLSQMQQQSTLLSNSKQAASVTPNMVQEVNSCIMHHNSFMNEKTAQLHPLCRSQIYPSNNSTTSMTIIM